MTIMPELLVEYFLWTIFRNKNKNAERSPQATPDEYLSSNENSGTIDRIQEITRNARTKNRSNSFLFLILREAQEKSRRHTNTTTVTTARQKISPTAFNLIIFGNSVVRT